MWLLLWLLLLLLLWWWLMLWFSDVVLTSFWRRSKPHHHLPNRLLTPSLHRSLLCNRFCQLLHMQLQTNLQKKHCLLLLFPHKEMVNVNTWNSNGAPPEVLKTWMWSQSNVPKWKTHTDCHVCISPHTHMDRMLNGTILNDGGLQTTASKRILNGFGLHFCHRSASDLFPIFPHSTSNQRLFQTSVPLRNGCFSKFCESYYHPSDCSKLIACHKSVFDWNSVCHWAGCVEESFPSYVDLDHVWKNVAYIQVRLTFLIRITQKILFGHRCANGFWELG